jgi:hypothetical protein
MAGLLRKTMKKGKLTMMLSDGVLQKQDLVDQKS